MNRFFTADADRYIGKKVLEYNNAESEEERLRLESFVKERTGILLYLIPQRNLRLLVLLLLPDIPHAPVSAYLCQVCNI